MNHSRVVRENRPYLLLEPGEGKPSRRVLRGEGRREAPALPDDLVLFGPNRDRLRLWRKQIAIWLTENRALALNPNKGHIRSTQTTQTYLGYRVSPWERQPGKKMVQRFRQNLSEMLTGPHERLHARLVAWKGVNSW